MTRFLTVLILLAMCLTADAGFAFADNSFKQYSRINFTWWGFKVYKAEVWTPKAEKPDFDNRIILHIKYNRNFKAKDLLETTLEEWERLKISNDRQRLIWINKLKKIWPDVKKGDSLTTFLDKDKTLFYQGNRLLGQVNEKEFGPAFLKIWLHKNSKTKSLLVKSK